MSCCGSKNKKRTNPIAMLVMTRAAMCGTCRHGRHAADTPALRKEVAEWWRLPSGSCRAFVATQLWRLTQGPRTCARSGGSLFATVPVVEVTVRGQRMVVDGCPEHRWPDPWTGEFRGGWIGLPMHRRWVLWCKSLRLVWLPGCGCWRPLKRLAGAVTRTRVGTAWRLVPQAQTQQGVSGRV